MTSKEVMDNTESHLEESNGVKSKEPSQQVPYKTVDMSEKKRSKKSASKKKVIELITPRDEELIRWVPTIEFTLGQRK